METRILDGRPSENVLTSLAESKLSWRIALQEWIDNSLDAHAKTINVVIVPGRGSGSVQCIDDGEGCSDLEAFIKIGGRATKAGRGTIGRYGIGSKDASLWFAGPSGRIDVKSTCEGITRYLTTSWAVIGKSWGGGAPPVETSSKSKGHVGTMVMAAPLERTALTGAQWKNLVDQLAYSYWPALADGVQISIESGKRGAIALKQWSPPRRLPIPRVCGTITVGGKSARLDIGVVAENERNPYPGISYIHDRRVVIESGAHGCGSNSFSRIFGTVHLDETWRLTKNKEDLRDAEALYDEIERLCTERDVFSVAHRMGGVLKLDALKIEIESFINTDETGAPIDDEKKDKKAKRNPAENHTGTAEGTGKGGKHKKAKKKQPGDTMTDGDAPTKKRKRKQRRARLELAWDSFGDDLQMARVDGPLITLNTDHPFIHAAKQTDNAQALAAVIFAHIATDDVRNPGSAIDRGRPTAIPLTDILDNDPRTAFGLSMAKLGASRWSLPGAAAGSASKE